MNDKGLNSAKRERDFAVVSFCDHEVVRPVRLLIAPDLPSVVKRLTTTSQFLSAGHLSARMNW